MNFDWRQLTELDYWLEGIAGDTVGAPFIEIGSFTYWLFLYVFSTAIIVGICMRVAQAFIHSQHPLQKKIPNWATTISWMGILGLSWFLMRQLNIGILGARLWMLALCIWVIVSLSFAIRYFMYFYPIEIAYFRKNVLPKKD